MGELHLLFYLMAILVLAALIALFVPKSTRNSKVLFICAFIFTLLITAINISAYPDNFILQKIIAGLWAVGAMAFCVLYFVRRDKAVWAKIGLSAMMVISLLGLFFF